MVRNLLNKHFLITSLQFRRSLGIWRTLRFSRPLNKIIFCVPHRVWIRHCPPGKQDSNISDNFVERCGYDAVKIDLLHMHHNAYRWPTLSQCGTIVICFSAIKELHTQYRYKTALFFHPTYSAFANSCPLQTDTFLFSLIHSHNVLLSSNKL